MIYRQHEQNLIPELIMPWDSQMPGFSRSLAESLISAAGQPADLVMLLFSRND
jgi:hypothetical protein